MALSPAASISIYLGLYSLVRPCSLRDCPALLYDNKPLFHPEKPSAAFSCLSTYDSYMSREHLQTSTAQLPLDLLYATYMSRYQFLVPSRIHMALDMVRVQSDADIVRGRDNHEAFLNRKIHENV